MHVLQATPEMHTMGKFLMELCLPDYTTLEFLPSQIAAAALCLTMKMYKAGEWVCVMRILIVLCACKVNIPILSQAV